MEKFDAAQKMRRLIEYLNYHQDQYDAGTPKITDKEWDEAYMELKALEQEFPNIDFENSPTKKIRYSVVNELKKVKHDYQPMLSLDKTKDIEKVKEFLGSKAWIAMLKLDGLTCRLTYEEGKLVRAETRGDGIEGEDITHNARVLPSIPQTITYKDTLVVDGEVICDKATFEQFKDEYANCRNFAAGSIRLLDSNECAKRGLTFVAWDIIYGAADGFLSERLEDLNDMHFRTVPYYTNRIYDIFGESTIEGLVDMNDDYYDYPIDGIVVKYDDCYFYYAAGRTDHHFRGGLAYKFYDEEYETELLDIEWSMGRTGVLTPVAIYKDVEIDGATCNRANLHNISVMQEVLGEYPHLGQTIWVAKMNQIIPQVMRANKNDDSLLSCVFNIPNTCPICGGEALVHESIGGSLELLCMDEQCPGKLINKLDHFCGKKGLDIKGLSKATLSKLIDWGWVNSISDLFKLKDRAEVWMLKPGFGEKSVTKIIDAIEEARHTTLEKYLSAISISLIGKTYARELALTFGDYESFREEIINYFDFESLEGFGPAMHEAIVTFDYSEADSLVDNHIVDFTKDEVQLENSGNAHSLEGLSIAITGKLKLHKNRDELKSKIEAAGGKVVSSVSSKTNYLVNNDNTSDSAKNKTAKSLNIPIITEEELMQLL